MIADKEVKGIVTPGPQKDEPQNHLHEIDLPARPQPGRRLESSLEKISLTTGPFSFDYGTSQGIKLARETIVEFPERDLPE